MARRPAGWNGGGDADHHNEKPAPAPPGARLRITTRGVFTGATAVALLRALRRVPGPAARASGSGSARAAPPARIALRRRGGRQSGPSRISAALRAATAFTFAVLATVNGAMHVQHIRVDGAAHSDLTSMLALAAGLVLAGLAVFSSHRRPGGSGCSPCRSRSSARSLVSARWPWA